MEITIPLEEEDGYKKYPSLESKKSIESCTRGIGIIVPPVRKARLLKLPVFSTNPELVVQQSVDKYRKHLTLLANGFIPYSVTEYDEWVYPDWGQPETEIINPQMYPISFLRTQPKDIHIGSLERKRSRIMVEFVNPEEIEPLCENHFPTIELAVQRALGFNSELRGKFIYESELHYKKGGNLFTASIGSDYEHNLWHVEAMVQSSNK